MMPGLCRTRPTACRRRPVWAALIVLALLFLASGVSMVVALTTSERALYTDLGLTKEASKDDIKHAFRRLTRENHPDTKETFDEKEAAKVAMARILRAYEVLSDEAKRQDYDQSGFIPGEAFDPKEHSAKDIFEHYHQHMPIFSKTETIESMATIDRIKSFRGARIHLVQVYDDSCKKCRDYSGVWETLYHSGLVSAGVVKMYRVDYKSPDGPKLAKALGMMYTTSDPSVAAFVDGEKWALYGIRESMKRNSERVSFEHLLDFVMNFFYESHVELSSLQVPYMDGVVQFLQAPRAPPAGRPQAKPPVRVLLPKLNMESLPLALHMRLGDRAVVRSLAREPLIDFVEQYCKMEVTVYDRRGDPVPLPEFIVVSTQVVSAAAAAQTEDADADEDAAKPVGTDVCKGIELGASVALTYDKAYQFVNGLLPPLHEGMTAAPGESTLPYLDAMAFAEVCERNCIMWVRESCEAPSEELALQELQATAKLLTSDFLSFRTGYLCLDEQPLVAEFVKGALPDALGRTSNRGPLLLMIADGNDHTLYAATALQSRSPLELSTRDVDALLSHVVDVNGASATGHEDVPVSADTGIHVLPSDAAFTSFIPFTPFPMSSRQRYSILANTAFSFVYPYISNTLPFICLYFIHTKVLRKNDTSAASGGSTAEAPAGSAGAKAAPPASGLPKFPTPRRGPRRRSPEPPRPKNVVCDFAQADLEEAKEGKGFLVLLLDDRPLNSPALKLPLIMSDARFTVRMLSSNTSKWNEWVRQQVSEVSSSAAAEGAAEPTPVPEEERGLALFAIRKGRMQGVAKPAGKEIEAFLRDLLDGTQSARVSLPDFASS